MCSGAATGCTSCHAGAGFTDNKMHDVNTGYGVRETTTLFATPVLHGLAASGPYLHDGRLLTLADTVEFFNLILETHLTADEKTDLEAFLRVL